MSLWHWKDIIVLLGASIGDILINGVSVVCDALLSLLRSQMFLTFNAQTDVIELRVRVDDIKIDSKIFTCTYIHVTLHVT